MHVLNNPYEYESLLITHFRMMFYLKISYVVFENFCWKNRISRKQFGNLDSL